MLTNYSQSRIKERMEKPRSVITLRGAQFLFLYSILYILCSSAHVSALTSVNTSNKNVVTNGLIGHWTFDGKNMTNATATDISGYGNNGTLINMRATSSKIAGKIGQGLTYKNSKQQYINLNAPSALNLSASTSNITVMAWIKTPPSIINSHLGVVKRGEPNAGYTFDQYFLGTSNDRFKFSMTNGVTFKDAETTGGVVLPNTWYFIVGVADTSTQYMYVNGVLRATTTRVTGEPPAVNTTTLIGTMNIGNGSWEGIIDDVRIYNRALSVKEIQTLYKAGGGVTQASVSNTKANTNGVGLSDGLVGHWTFDGKNMTNATATDISGNNKHGTLTNMTTNSSKIAGKIGQALNFNGSNNRVEINSVATSVDLTNFSVSFWEKTSSSTNIFGTIFSFGSSTNTNAIVEFATNFSYPGDGMFFCFRDDFNFGNPECARDASTVYRNGVWHHFIGTRQGNVATLYRDGVLIQQVILTGVGVGPITVSKTTIGALGRSYPSLYFDGSVDDVRIYNRVLSGKEVTSLYKLGQNTTNVTPTVNVSGISSGLVGHWTFDGKNMTNATATDISGNGNNGALVNMTANSSKIAGKIGQAMYFKGGIGSMISIPDSSVFDFSATTSEFTLVAWIKPDDDLCRGIIKSGAGTSGGVHHKYMMGTYSGRRVEFTIGDGISENTILSGTNVILPNKWNLVVCLVDLTTLKCFVNGELKTQNTRTINASQWPQVTIIGSARTNADYFSGSIDDVRIYNRALSAKEIQSLYKLGSNK